MLMVTYNGEKYVSEQIESILNQKVYSKYTIDFYIRDNSSIDNTLHILEKYTERYSNINVYSMDNDGPALSFLYLLKKVKGYKFYFLCDQDDYWENNKVAVTVDKLSKASGPALFFSNAELVDGNLRSLNLNVYDHKPNCDLLTIACGGGILGCTVGFNKELRDCVAKLEYTEKDIIMHDYLIAMTCAAVGGKFYYSTDTLVKYRQHGNNVLGVSVDLKQKINSRFRAIFKKRNISISKQAEVILNTTVIELSKRKKKELHLVSQYKKSFLKRLYLASSLKTKYYSLNTGLCLRLSLLLGNM